MTRRLRIGIFEDVESFAALMAVTLENDFDIVIGHNGEEGLSVCLENPPDLVITDIGMPEMDGIQMLTEFQKYPRLAAIPVVVVTATHFTRRHKDEVSRFPQVRRMLSKDASVDLLAEEIRKVVAEAYYGAPPPPPPPPPPED